MLKITGCSKAVQIQFHSELEKITEPLDINPEIDLKTEAFDRILFVKLYTIIKRPKFPNVKMEFKISLAQVEICSCCSRP